jgi:hypothetical protein
MGLLSGGILGQGQNMKKPPTEEGQPAPPPVQKTDVADLVNSFLKKSTDGVTVQGGIDTNTKYWVGGIALAIILSIVLTRKK